MSSYDDTIIDENISGVANYGTGMVTVSWGNDFAAGNEYVVVGNRENGVITINSPSAGSFRLDSRNYSGTSEESGEVYIAAFGPLA